MLLLLLACNPGDPGISGRYGEGEAWALTFGATATDEAWGLAALDDGGVVVGTFQSAPEMVPDTYSYRLDADGNEAWSAAWGGDSLDKAFPVSVQGETVYVGGTTYAGAGNDSADAFVIALELESGVQRWSWTSAELDYGYEEVDEIIPDGGRLHLTGWGTVETNDAMWAALSAETGELENMSFYDSGGWDEANGGAALVGDRLYFTGIEDGEGYAVGGTGIVAAVDLDSGLQWTTPLPGCDSYCDGLGLVSDGEVLYTVGVALDGLHSEIDVHAFDLDGAELWASRYEDAEDSFARALDLRDGVLRVAGNADDEIVVLEIDAATGERLTTAIWGCDAPSLAHEIAVTDDAVWVAGQTECMGAGAADGLLLHFPLDLSALPPTG